MYLKNDTSPKPIYAILVNASDGAPITSGVTAYHIQGTTRTAGAGTLTHIANGRWAYTPTQAETNYDAFAIDFYHDDAVGKGALVEVVTANAGLAVITSDTSAIRQAVDAKLDVAVSTRLASGDYEAPDNDSIAAIKEVVETNLDAKVSTRLASEDYVEPDNNSISTIKEIVQDKLDEKVSSRLASQSYVAPDNASISAIKTQTDKFQFDSNNYVYAVGIGGGSATDWTDTEKQQIRYRLGIDGTTASPQSNTPHLGSSYADLDQLASHGDSAWATVSPAAIWSHDTRTITGGTVTTVNDKSDYRLSAQGVDDIWDEQRSGHTIAGSFGYYLDAAISSRSTFNPATQQVIVATNNDKTGYSLAPDQSSVIIGQVNNLGGAGLAAVADAVWDELRSQHTTPGTYGVVSEWAGGGGGSVQVIVQPLQATVQQPSGEGGTITFWLHAKPRASWVVDGEDLTGRSLYLIVYDRRMPNTAIATFSTANSEITVTYDSGNDYSLIQLNGADNKITTIGDYDYVIRDQTNDAVLLSGRCLVHGAPDVDGD